MRRTMKNHCGFGRRFHSNGPPPPPPGGPFRRREVSGHSGLYRSRKGIFLGVCRGFADYFNTSVGWVRVLALILLFATAFWPVAALYVILGLILKPEPVMPLENEAEQEFYDSYTSSRTRAVGRLKREYDTISRRIQRLEDIVTRKDFDWDRRMSE